MRDVEYRGPCNFVFVINLEREEDRVEMSGAIEQAMDVTSVLFYRVSEDRCRRVVYAGIEE